MDEVTVSSFEAPAAASDRVDWRQVRLLVAMSWRIKFNRASARPVWTAVGLFFLFVMACLSVVAAVFLAAWMKFNRPDLAAGTLHYVFLVVFFMLAITPVLGFRGNEFLDVTKLFIMPVGHRTVFASTLIALLCSGSVLFFALFVVAAVIGYASTVGQAVAGIVAGLLLVAVATALGQFLLLAFLNTWRSRKWRDVMMVVAPLLAGGMLVAFQILPRMTQGTSVVLGALDWFARHKDKFLPLPSWWAANTLTGTGVLRFLPTLALAAVLLWLVRLSADLQERAFYGEAADDLKPETVRGHGLAARVGAALPDPMGASVEKELTLLRREPAVRSVLVGQSVYPMCMFGFIVWKALTRGEGGDQARFAPFASMVVYSLLLMELGLTLNILGLDGPGIVHGLLMPVSRRTMILAKNVAYLIVFGTLNAVVAVVLTIVAYAVLAPDSMGDCAIVAALGALEGYCAMAIALAIGNVVAVLAPQRLAVRDRRILRQQTGGREGCLRGVIGVSAVMSLSVLAVPMMLAFHFPTFLHAAKPAAWPDPTPWWLALTALGAVALAYVLVRVSAAIGGRLLEAREEEVTARLARSDE